MKVVVLILCTFLFGFTNCSHLLPYQDDKGTMPSGFYYGGSPEFTVMVNGKFCLDSEGKTGMCILRHKRNKDFVTKILGRSYDYYLSIKCNDPLQANIDSTFVPKGQSYIHTVKSEMLVHIDESFYCRGNVKRNSADTNPTSSYLIIVAPVKKDYAFPAIPYRNGKRIVLSKYSKYAQCYIKGKWKRFNKLTVFEHKYKTSCFYETYNGKGAGYELQRYNQKNN